MRHVFSRSLLLLCALLLLGLLPACGNEADTETDSPTSSDDSVDEIIDSFDPFGFGENESSNSGDATTPDEGMEPPLGDNPALGYGPYEFTIKKIRFENEDQQNTAYLFIPDIKGPQPTLVWGHGLWAADFPMAQREMFIRLATRGFLVVYPNLEVNFPFPRENDVTNAVGTYLQAARQAVRDGYADPERIVFGGYSFGARIAGLATGATCGLDPLNLWPDPVASVYEAMHDVNHAGVFGSFHVPGPLPSDWAYMIDPPIDQTIICAEDDEISVNFDPRNEEPQNGVYFYHVVPTNFAQLIILQSGTTFQDRATHSMFTAPNENSLDALDLWGHVKIVNGLMQYRFHGRSKEWSYGYMRKVGGLDHDNKVIVHEVYERGEITHPQILDGILP